MEKTNLIKKVRGINTYRNVIDTEFRELLVPPIPEEQKTVTISEFFGYYDQLFYDIPVSGENSHTELVNRSQQYIGGGINDPEKQALVEEINSLRQQIIDLSQTYITVGDLTK